MTPATVFRAWQRAAWVGLALPMYCWGCVFQQSWARGWPGLSQGFVFGAVFAVAAFLGAFGLGGAATLAFATEERLDRLRWRHLAAFLLPTAVVGLVLASAAFSLAYST